MLVNGVNSVHLLCYPEGLMIEALVSGLLEQYVFQLSDALRHPGITFHSAVAHRGGRKKIQSGKRYNH